MSGSASIANTRPFRHRARKPHGEVTCARADVGDGRIRGQLERADHLVRLLPGVTLGVVEDRGPLLGAGKALVVMATARRRARCEREAQRAPSPVPPGHRGQAAAVANRSVCQSESPSQKSIIVRRFA